MRGGSGEGSKWRLGFWGIEKPWKRRKKEVEGHGAGRPRYSLTALPLFRDNAP